MESHPLDTITEFAGGGIKMLHELKIELQYFQVHKDDRSYQIGDMLKLKEYHKGNYTGREI